MGRMWTVVGIISIATGLGFILQTLITPSDEEMRRVSSVVGAVTWAILDAIANYYLLILSLSLSPRCTYLLSLLRYFLTSGGGLLWSDLRHRHSFDKYSIGSSLYSFIRTLTITLKLNPRPSPSPRPNTDPSPSP